MKANNNPEMSMVNPSTDTLMTKVDSRYGLVVCASKRARQLLDGEESFSVETTLATRSYIRLVEKAHARGFRVSLLFLWLNSPEMARLRVSQRVSEGGHNIDDDVIRRRYKLGIQNLFNLFIPIADDWAIYDNSVTPRICVASGTRGAMIDIFDADRYSEILSLCQ